MTNRYKYELPEHKVEYGVYLDVDEIEIDEDAQRTINERRAQMIAKDFVREAIGTLIVSKRDDGRYFLVDGQHRRRACQIVGVDRVPCEVHHNLTQVEEAILFLIKNRESSKPNAIDEYRIGVTGGIPLFVDTEKVLKSRGLAVGKSSTNFVGAVNGVLRITEEFGPDVLARTLDVAEKAWGRTSETWDGMLLGGLGRFLGRHGDQVSSDTELAKKIGREPAWKWKANVHALSTHGGTSHSGTGGRIGVCYTEIVKAWNKGRRTDSARISL